MAAGDFAAFYVGAYPDAKRLAHLLLDGSPATDDLVRAAFDRLRDEYGGITAPEDHLRAALVELCSRVRAGSAPAGRHRPPAGPVEIRDPLLDDVHALPPRERAAVVLRYWSALGDAGIAAALGVDSPHARDLLGRALDRLDGGRGIGIDLERDLRDALALEARTVLLPDPEWTGTRPSPARRSRRPAVAAATAIAVAVGLFVAWPQPELEPAAAVEDRGARLDAQELEWSPQPFVVGPINPASFRVWRAGGAEYVTYQTIETRPGARVLDVWCVERQYREPSCYPFTAFQGMSMYDSLDDAGNRMVQVAAAARALRCLSAAGLHSDPRRPVPSDVDVGGVWRGCVGEARDGAKAAFEQLGGRVVESRADDPSILGAG